MNLTLSIGPLISLIAGILILVMPKLLNYIVALYLINCAINLGGITGAAAVMITFTCSTGNRRWRAIRMASIFLPPQQWRNQFRSRATHNSAGHQFTQVLHSHARG